MRCRRIYQTPYSSFAMRTISRTATASAGSTTVISGMLRMIAMSSNGMWVLPLSAVVMPGSEPTILTFCFA